MSVYAAPASCFWSIVVLTFRDAGTYNQKKTNNLATSTRLKIKIMDDRNTANGFVGCTFSAVGLGGRHSVFGLKNTGEKAIELKREKATHLDYIHPAFEINEL